jgi:hypothetical protein
MRNGTESRRRRSFESHKQPPDSARFTFLDPAAQAFFVDWERAAERSGGSPSLDRRPQRDDRALWRS